MYTVKNIPNVCTYIYPIKATNWTEQRLGHVTPCETIEICVKLLLSHKRRGLLRKASGSSMTTMKELKASVARTASPVKAI